jgi:hypothetical protein
VRHDGLSKWASLPMPNRYRMSQPVKETGWKGAAKLHRVPPVGLNKQNGLNCTGCGPPTTGRATAGSMVRQRSMRRKPLYLDCNSLDGQVEPRECDQDWYGLMFRTGWYDMRIRWWVTPSILPSRVARGRACHLRTQGLGIGTWEPVSPACYGSRLAAETGDG